MRNSDLRQRAESIMRLMEQRDELSADIKAAFDAAKREKHDSEQMDLEMYLAEIEGKAMEKAA